jgi:hypothetical protein
MILRSAFWLAVGFAFMAPHGTDFGAAAKNVKDQVLAAGAEAATQIVVGQVLSKPTVEAIANRLTSTSPSVTRPMQDSATATFVFPRPRPAAMG